MSQHGRATQRSGLFFILLELPGFERRLLFDVTMETDGGRHEKRRQYCFSVIGLFLLTLPVVSVAHAQVGDYPQKPVMIISDAAAGTAPDITARFVAKGLGEIWRQQVVVVNRPEGTAVSPLAQLQIVPLTAIRFSCRRYRPLQRCQLSRRIYR